MYKVDKKSHKILIFSILVSLIIFSAYFVHAQFFSNAYVVRTINVFPSVVESEGWNNVETITFQNLGEYALLQEFNTINSATLDEDYWSHDTGTSTSGTPEPVVNDNDVEVTPVPEVEFEFSVPSTGDSVVPQDMIDYEVPVVSQTSTEDVQIVVPEPEVVLPEEEAVESGTTTVLRRAGSLFSLAVSTVTSLLDGSSSTEAVNPSVSLGVAAEDSTALSDEVIETTIDEAEVVEVVPEPKVLTTEDVVEDPVNEVVEISAPEESIPSTTVSIDTEKLVEDIPVVETDPVVETIDEVVDLPDVLDIISDSLTSVESDAHVACTDDCQPFTITLSDFGYPIGEGVEVTGAQLRLSVGAEKKQSRERIPSLDIRYTIDDGQTWNSAGLILIEDQVSSGINGGYYLFALQEVISQETLNTLKVEISYQDNPEIVKGLFVESAWLELFTLEAPEEPVSSDILELLANDGYDDTLMSGDKLISPEGDKIEFDFTDDNKNETLIIKSDKVSYSGLSEVTTYFSVTNTTDADDEFSLQTYFPSGVGEVKNIEVYNRNKPRDAVIPEYRPYVYNCEAGWEYAGEFVPQTLEELSQKLAESLSEEVDNGSLVEPDVQVGVPEETIETSVDEGVETKDVPSPAADSSSEIEVDFAIPETSPADEASFDETITNNTTTVLNLLNTTSKLLQSDIITTTDEALVNDVQTDPVVNLSESGDEKVPAYTCRNTNVVRECDELDGENTACLVKQVKVDEHPVTQYAPGWDKVDLETGGLPKASLLRRMAEFVGFGPDKKEVPDAFEVRSHTGKQYVVKAGETKYFKMDISFPPFSNGEYWIEAIGDSEYGLLDPFWSSQWQYRMPIRVPNPTGSSQSEYQMFFELDSSLTDFWSNVNSDGSDVRFVQEVVKGNLVDENNPEFDNPYDKDWTGRMAITIPATSVSTGLADFPVYIDMSTLGPAFWSGVASDGRDIRITKQDGVSELPYDLVEIDTTAETGELHFLANALSSVSDNTFHIYYNNPSATAYASTSQYGSQAVWANYEAVYHFSDDPTAVTNVITDFTGNGQELEVEGAALATTTGAMGTALDMTGSTGVLRDVGDDWGWTAGDDLVSSGLYFQSAVSGEALWEFGSTANPNWAGYMPWYANADPTIGRGYMYFGLNQNGTWNRNTAVWHHFTTIAPSTAGNLHGIYDNGVLELSGTQNVTDPSNLGGLQVGRWTTGGSYNGIIDELRFAADDTVYTPGWISTEHLNQTDPTTFYSTSTKLTGGGSREGWYSTSWENRTKFTLAQSSDLTDFPVYLDLATLGDDFFNNVASDGRDIRITNGDNTAELPFELVSIDTGAKTGELYFKTDLTADASTDYYIYYNNSDAAAYAKTAIYGAENVWTNGYVAVYHLEEDMAGISNANVYKDSTSNQYDGDDENSSDGKLGLFGAGQEFGDSQNDYLSLPKEVLDGTTNVSVSWWHNSSTTGDMTITSGANSSDANEFWDRLNNNNRVYIYSQGQQELATIDNSDTYNDGTWQYYMTIRDYDAQYKSMVRNGVLDAQSPIVSNPVIAAHTIDNGGLVIGQDQDSVGGGFSSSENFEGFLDELRYADVVRDPSWAAAEYENMANQSSFISTSTAETLSATNFVELDFWIQHFDDTADEADIWVQLESLPAGEDTIIYMYYGNSGAASASDELATFSYSTSTDIYYVVDDSGASSVTVESLVDNNEVAIDGGTPVSLNQGESTTFGTFTGASVISVLGPISGTVTGASSDGSDMIVPISFATTTFAIPTNRNTNRWYIVSPFASSTIRTYIAAAGSPSQTLNAATGTVVTSTTEVPNSGQGVDGSGLVIDATAPVLAIHRSTNPGDGLTLYPPTNRDLFGVTSNFMHVSALASNSDPTVTCSTGAGGTITGITRGDHEADASCTAAAEGAGSAVRLSGQASPITALQQADSDGTDSSMYWPQHEFGTRYAMTNSTGYVAVVCSPRFGSVDLEVQDTLGNTVSTGTCTPSGSNPGKAYFNNGNGTDGDAVNYTGGHQIVSTNGEPFYMMYEDVSVDQDEKNAAGPVQGRKFDGIVRDIYQFGNQEIANPTEYEQLSYLWYQNSLSNTPTSTWENSPGEYLVEAQNITGAGAVDNGDVLRLRINAVGSNATATANTQAFNLQYAAASTGQCSTATAWNDVGQQGSTTAVFNGYNNSGVADGEDLVTSTLASTTVLGTYEERNYSDFIPSQVNPGDVVEWDWVITANDIAVNSNYCFRMVKATGEVFETYTAYPELETVGPPSTPVNLLFFDNENTAVLTPVLEFYAIDNSNDDINYQIQIDDDYDFSSVVLDKNSDTNFLQFENLAVPSDKSPFNSGQRVRFTGLTGLTPTTTYYWRVRADDPGGSATTSDWSEPFSFTTDTTVTVSEWMQTTGRQFDTNSLTSLSTSSGAVTMIGSTGQMTSTPIYFNNGSVGNAWGEVSWNDTETSGTILISVQYNNNGSWTLVPDSLIPGNSLGTSTSPINLLELDTSTYGQIRLVANFAGTTLSLQDWKVKWGLRVETPDLGDLFDNQKTPDLLPVFDFVSSDPQGDDLEYEISFSTDYNFITSSSTYNSSVDAGFIDTVAGTSSSPFGSGNRVTYTKQAGSPFVDGNTYWWRVRAKDPNGGDSWSPWSVQDSFTVDVATTLSTWFQTTRAQFSQGVLDGTIATSGGAVIVSEDIGEYGTATLTNNNWLTINTQRDYTNMVVTASPEYAGPLWSGARTPRVRNKTSNSFEIKVDDYTDAFSGSTVVDYMVMEAGDWIIQDGGSGVRILADTVSVSGVQNQPYANNVGTDITFSPAFSAAPVALTTVSSDNETAWVATNVDDGTTSTAEVTTTNMGIALSLSRSGTTHSTPEDVDYMVIEPGSGTNKGVKFKSMNSTDNVDDYQTNGGYGQALAAGFSVAPGVTVIANNGTDGGDGGFAYKNLSGSQTAGSLFMSIHEMGATADQHTQEIVSIMAFENSSGLIARLNAGNLSGTFAGEDIIFSDGAGPKFDNFAWNDSTPATSEILYQIEYEVSDGVYALIPDSQIPGNSTGTTTSPIDLTNVDIDAYPIIRAFATLTCGGGSCPQLDDWQLEWSEGVNMSGTLKEYDRTTNVATGTVKVAVNGSPVAGTGSVVAGVWTFNNVTAFNGDIINVWVDGAAESEEAVAAFVYDGLGDISGVELFEQHLSISSDEDGTVTNALLALYDNSVSANEDIFYEVDASNNLVVCGVGSCADANIYVGPGDKYIASAVTAVSVTAHDLINDGSIELDTNTFNISGSWDNNATSSTDTATINMTAATGTESVSSTETPLKFHNMSFGSGAGDATFTIPTDLDLSGNLTVASGTLDRGSYKINLAGSLLTGAGGYWVGTATTTFDGGSGKTWTDNNPVKQNVGDVVIDGASAFVSVTTDVAAYDVTIGYNDTLAGGSAHTIYVAGDWTNNGTFNAGTSRVEIVVDDRTYPPVVPGSADWYADSNFDKRLAVVVDSNEVPGTLTDFPIFVDLSTLGNSFWTDVAGNGKDIRVTSDDGQTELPHDLVAIDNTAKTGELHFLADSVSGSTSTTFYIYFDNPSATAPSAGSQYGSEAVWKGYEAVWHFNEVPSLGATLHDATGNGRNLVVDTEALATTSGQMGVAVDLAGSTGILTDDDYSWTAGDKLVSSGWYYQAAASTEALWSWGTSNDYIFMPWYSGTTGYFRFGSSAGGTNYVISPRNGTIWHHFSTLAPTSTGATMNVYEDSILRDTTPLQVDDPTAGPLQIGRYQTAGSLEGSIDELRFSTTTQSTNWVQAEYSNQKHPTIFYATTSVQTYVPDLVIDEATHDILAGGSSFYDLYFNDATTSPAFVSTSAVVSNDFTIASGTVALPTGKLTIGGSFLNTGYFMHNNSEIEFNGAGAETITLSGTDFFNVLYDVTFSGSGSWVITDTNATTSNDFIINSGTVTFPSGVLNIGGTLDVNSGGFNANGGTVYFTSAVNESVVTLGSSFNNVIFGSSEPAEQWYDQAWNYRTAIVIASSSVYSTLTDFPVYVDLSTLGTDFWDNVTLDGRGLRMTQGDGITEVPIDLVSINVGAQTGELHFLANQLSSTADTTFYLYHNNSDALTAEADSTYGSQAVWAGYAAVYHFNDDPTLGVTDESGHGKDLSPLVGTPVISTGKIGNALDTTGSSILMGDSDWTWTAGEDLVSSGWYYQTAVDAGALWQWGDATGSNNDTWLAFMPWYTGTTGYHRFGVTTGDTYYFARTGTEWHHFTTNGMATPGLTNEIFEDALVRDTLTQTVTNPTNTGLKVGRYQTGNYYNALIDELRFATTSRSYEWVQTEYANQSDASSFYTSNTETYLEVVPSFTLNESVTDVDGDVTIQYANLVSPSSNFKIGGSALNIFSSYDPNNATTTFDSTDTGETVQFGVGAFYNLAFDGVGGGWTIATTTVNNDASLLNGYDFTLQSGTVLSVGGRFTNDFNAASTTWAGTTLSLSGGDYTVTHRLDSGDDYAKVIVSGDSDIVIWNSSISTSSVRDNSSLYLPDYGGSNGLLRIYGEYTRSSGTEYWSYATDFDGTDLTGGGERPVTVEIGRAAEVTMATGTTLSIIGDSAASTTIDAITGIYDLTVNAGTLDATYFTVTGAGPEGLHLTNGTILNQLSSAEFNVAGGRSGITADADTINAQPSTEFSLVNFATSSFTSIYEPAWTEQVVVTIQSSVVTEDLTNYPVYINLADLGDTFWSNVQSDGRDIRVTTNKGIELPIDLVEINAVAKTGELHFLASNISSNENTAFYIHFGNPSATAYAQSDEYGANAVWIGYEAVYHFNEDPTVRITDVSGNGRDLLPTVGTAATTTGLLGTAIDTTAGNVRLENTGWTWTPGEDLISSGLYFQSAFDTGALWQFGSGNGTNNGSYLAFLPWYDNATRGYHYFGITTGGDYNFARNNTIWHHFTTIGRAADGALNEFYQDNILRDTVAQITSSANPTNTGLRIGAYQTTTYMDIDIDELRFATTTRSAGWIDTQYRNLTNRSTFYATSSAQTTTYNVTADGVPSTFWRFSGGIGDLYGEAFDNDDGDPGSIQWDDSNFAISISGTVYSDDGVTPATAPLCNNSTEVVTVVLDGVTTYTAPCDPLDGTFTVSGISYTGEPQIVTYINSEATASQVNVGIYDEITGNGNVTSNLMTVSRPAVVDGSVLVLIAGKDDDINFNAPPAGWVAVDVLGNTTGDNITTGIWYKVVATAGTEPATYDFSVTDAGEGFSYWMGSLINVDTSTPIDVASVWSKLQNQTDPVAQGINTVTNGALVLSAWYSYIDTETVAPIYDWSARAENILDSANNNLTVVSRLMTTAGDTGSTSISGVISTRETHVGQFAFRPASSPTATGTMVAAAVTKTPLGSTGAPYETVELRDQRNGFGTVLNGANIVVNRPAVQNGDVMFAIIGKEDDFSITPPAGWVIGADRLEATGNDMYSAIWYHEVTNAGSEPATYDFLSNDDTIEEYSYWVGSFSGVDTTNVFDVTPAWSNLQNDSSPAAPTLTTTKAGAYVLAAWYVIDDGAMDMPAAPWKTLAQDLQVANRLLAVSGRPMPTVGATGAAVLTGGSVDDVNVGQFAIRPAPVSVASNITDMDLYQDRVIVRHEDILPLTIADMTVFDNGDDSDLPFTASTGSPDLLTVLSGSGLVVWNNRTFDSGGQVVLAGAGATSADGSLLVNQSGIFKANGSDGVSIGGSLYLDTSGSFVGATSNVDFTATNAGQTIGAAGSATITFNDISFSGVDGNWAVQTPIVSETGINVATGTLSGTNNITVNTGSFKGNGTVNMTGGTTLVKRANTFGGTTPWTLYNLTLGDGTHSEITTPATNATTTVSNVLTIATSHFLNAYGSVWDLQGSGNPFVENGTFVEATSTVRYSGATPNIKRTAYYNLVVDNDGASTVVATAPTTGLQVLKNFTVGALGTSTINVTTNDPTFGVGGKVYIGTKGTLIASNSQTLTAQGDWENDGTFTSSGGTVAFTKSSGSATIAAGNSTFGNVSITGTANYTISENATTTGSLTLSAGTFTLASGQRLAVGGSFSSTMSNVNTTWTGTTLYLYSGTSYTINAKTKSETFENIITGDGTHPRVWNATTTSVVTDGASSLYSMNHQGVVGSLMIYGDYVNSSYSDYWDYAKNFDGVALGSSRQAVVTIENGGSVKYQGGSLELVGSTTASTTVAVEGGSGTYDFTIGGTTAVNMNYYQFRNTTIDGLVFTGAPSVSDISHGDFEVAIDGGSTMTVGGAVITANPALNFTGIRMATTTAINAYNVTATGTSASAWRFVNVVGNLDGEAKDNDPGGDPGYVTWQDSAAIINISGTVYSDEGSSVSAACDGTTNNVILSVHGLSIASTTCNGDGLGGGTGDYSFVGVNFGLGNTLTVYIGGETEKAATVTKDPISSLSNMDLYENRVIVRHESAAAMTIAAMSVWDSSDDADIPFTAVNAGTDTLDLPADFKLLVWDSKKFTPAGNVTVPGGGSGSAFDGTIELQDNALFTAANGETHTFGGSFISGTNAVFNAAQSSVTFTSAVAGRTININNDDFYNLTFNGAGDWTITDSLINVGGNLTITAGDIVLPTGATTITGSFNNNGGTFDANGGSLVFNSTASGKTVKFGGSDANTVRFAGTAGTWTMSDTNATATDSFTVATGTVTLPTGVLTVGDDFVVKSAVTHAGGEVKVTGTGGGNLVTLAASTLGSLTIDAGAGDYTLTDASAALTKNLTIQSGSFTVGTGTLSVGGSFDASAGTFTQTAGTVLFNSSDTGEIINAGANIFYNMVLAGAGGGWTIVENATTTNNFTLSLGSSFTLSSGKILSVGGVFTNTLGGSATNWTGSTLALRSGTEYETNVKTTPVEYYDTLVLDANTDISSWNSVATTTVIPSTSSWYSQDHGSVDGNLNIYGDYHIATTTEYWSRATDFDGVALGSPRAVSVKIADGSVITVEGGGLRIIGTAAATSTVANQGSGDYTFKVKGGTFNASYYSFRNLDIDGLRLSGAPTITSLSNGDFAQAENSSKLITASSTVINANASLVITDTSFANAGYTGGTNIALNATTTNSWSVTGAYGNLWGEAYDIDGTDDCSSIRWDDSACLLTEQTTFRWRNDDGGEGAPASTWYNGSWSARKRVRVINADPTAYTDVAVKLTVAYDSDMQTDFDELRFTDSSGTNIIPHWIESYTTGVTAQVWVKVPTLATSSATEIFMYYGNVSATSTSDPSNVFEIYDDFEDDDIVEYSGDTSLFNTAGTFAYGGGFGLDTAGHESSKATDGIARTDITVAQGQILRFMQYVDTGAGSGDEVCTLFGVQSPVTINNNYAVCIEQYGVDRISLVKNAQNADTSGTVLASANVSYSTGWYEVEVDWKTTNQMDVSLFNSSGSLVATTSATDSTYTSGGIGFTYWGQNGGWDSYVSWPRTKTKPTAYFGVEQVTGGATWAAAQDTAVGGFAFGAVARLRIGVENTGLPITNQNFRLEFAPKLTAPSCEGVDGGSFVAVPNVASCGSSAICMKASAHISDNANTTDHLLTEAGLFVAGKTVTNSSNQTSNLNIDQNRYTELEYAITLTVNATNDAYCFRVTDGGSSLDSYAKLAELTLAFDPVLGAVSLNNGMDIALSPGATTTIIASTTVSDFNGVADLNTATTTFYKTSATASCTPDNNNCYVASSTACVFSDCTATSCTLTCSADFQFHADATDADGGEEWFAFMEVSDMSGATDFDTSMGVEVLTLRALEVQNAIGYGTVDINQNTGTYNPSVSLQNYGNEAIDVQIAGTDMTDGVASVIPASEQLFSTSTFDYVSCSSCNSLSVTGTNVEVDLSKPVVDTPYVSDDIYWGIEVPFGTASNPHSGVNTFTAISD